jgi:hypothetical protein
VEAGRRPHRRRGPAQLATATTNAAAAGLKSAANDHGVVESYWLLMRLPLAARAADFAATLGQCGVSVSDAPGLLEVVTAFTAAVDARMPDGRGRTDLGEMAQTAAAETLTAVVGGRTRGLFGTAPEDVRREFAALATARQFGTLARQFFTRFSFKCLNYFLSKALPDEVGPGKRFRTVAEQAKFTDALQTHCHEATRVVGQFAGAWFSKERFHAAGDITRAKAQAFLGHAMTKLTGEFRNREGTHGS